MLAYAFAKGYKYTNDGTLKIKVRQPSIHGPFKQTSSSRGTYTLDEDLPWLTSMLLPHMPNEGDVVVLANLSSSRNSEQIVIGLTGGNYFTGSII